MKAIRVRGRSATTGALVDILLAMPVSQSEVEVPAPVNPLNPRENDREGPMGKQGRLGQ